jgi:hypothetical protein
MIRASNYFAIGLRGADIDNGEFVFLKCSSCGTYALFDRETELLYTKPGDLTVSQLLLTRVSRCAACSHEGTFQDAPNSDFDVIMKSEWAFAIE